MKSLFISAIIGMFIWTSCKKEESKPADVTKKDSIPTVDSMVLKISASPWIVYRVDVSGINVWNTLIEDCQKDDSYRFYKDSTLMHYENADVCSGNPDSLASKWVFYDNKKKLVGTILGIKDTADVLTLRSDQMKLGVDYMGNPTTIYFKKP